MGGLVTCCRLRRKHDWSKRFQSFGGRWLWSACAQRSCYVGNHLSSGQAEKPCYRFVWRNDTRRRCWWQADRFFVSAACAVALGHVLQVGRLRPLQEGQYVLTGSSGVLGSVVFAMALLMLERDEPVDLNANIDYFGSYLGVAGLHLFNFCLK